jgi:hypothetical protein
MFARGKPGELIGAFAVTTKAREGIVKRSTQEWDALYSAWLKAAR